MYVSGYYACVRNGDNGGIRRGALLDCVVVKSVLWGLDKRRYGWLRAVFQGAHLSRSLIWCPSGGVAARERQGALSRRAW